MQKPFLMKTRASSALNFLIYMQNIFLNQNQSEEENLRYPYFSSNVKFKKEFEMNFKKLWYELSQRISGNEENGEKIFYEEKDLFFHRLFENSTDSLGYYNEIHKSFEVWWNSIAGRFSVERSIDNLGEKLYVDLQNWQTKSGIVPTKTLNISLVYDECQLADTKVSYYFAVLPIRDFVVKYKELVSEVQGCFY